MAPERLFLALPADGYRRCRLFFNISRETSMVHGRHRLPAGAGAYPSPRDLREARVPAGSRHLLGPGLTRGAARELQTVSILNELRRSRGKSSPETLPGTGESSPLLGGGDLFVKGGSRHVRAGGRRMPDGARGRPTWPVPSGGRDMRAAGSCRRCGRLPGGCLTGVFNGGARTCAMSPTVGAKGGHLISDLGVQECFV